MQKKKTLICFGLGYVAQYLIQQLQEESVWTVIGTTRRFSRQQKFQTEDFKVELFDSASKENKFIIPGETTHILISIPPDEQGDPVFKYFKKQILRLQNLEWLGYLSSTSVYGDHAGNWVDEETKCQPKTDRGKQRLEAEQKWLQLYKNYQLPIHIFRLSAIYGPGRSALDMLKDGKVDIVLKPNHFISRIHIDDLVKALLLSMNQPTSGEIFNLADDEPSQSDRVFTFAADLLGIKNLKFVSFDDKHISGFQKEFYIENKRVSNKKIKEVLGLTLKYLNYGQGLRSIYEQSRQEDL